MLAQKIVAAESLLPSLLHSRQTFRYISSKPLEDYKKALLQREPNINPAKLKAFTLAKMSWVWFAQGSKDAWRDFKTYRHTLKTPPAARSATQTIELQRIKKDLLKLIPFSFFVVVPFSELLLPFYLYFLPNSTPTCYRFDTSHEQEVREWEGRRDAAYRYFIGRLKAEGNFKLDDIQPAELRRKLAEEGPGNGTSLYTLTSEELVLLCDFLGVKEYLTGTNIVNRTANLFSYYLPTLLSTPWNLLRRKKGEPVVNWRWFLKYKDLPACKLNYGPFETLKRKLLLFQIERHLRNVRKVDSKLLTDGSVEYQPSTLSEFSRARGIAAANSSSVLKQEWLSFSTDPKVDLNQTVLYSLLLHHHHLQRAACPA